MAKIRPITQSILMWSHERGTLQYDIICALILAFIFFVPPSCFVRQKTYKQQSSYQNSHDSPSDNKANDPQVHAREHK